MNLSHLGNSANLAWVELILAVLHVAFRDMTGFQETESQDPGPPKA